MTNAQPFRTASAYKSLDKIVIHSHGRTPAGFYVACDPYFKLACDASAEDCGKTVLAALNAYRFEVPQPESNEWTEMTRALVRGVGAKSHKQLQLNAICCGILEHAARLAIEPTHNRGTTGSSKGFQPINEALVIAARDASSAEIGTALLRGFDLCTNTLEQQ